MAIRLDNSRVIRAPRGSDITAKSWLTEAPLRMLMNNLDPDVAEKPHELVVYGGIGRAARDWESFDRIVSSLRALEAFPDTYNPGYFIIKFAVWLLAGFSAVLAYQRSFENDGFRAGAARVIDRVRDIYLWHMALVAISAIGLTCAAVASTTPCTPTTSACMCSARPASSRPVAGRAADPSAFLSAWYSRAGRPRAPATCP